MNCGAPYNGAPQFLYVLFVCFYLDSEESVLTLMGSVAMEHKAFDRVLPRITQDKTLFPDDINLENVNIIN